MNNELNELATLMVEKINDSTFVSLLDAGIDPGIAYDATFKTDFSFLEIQPADLTEYDDLVQDETTFVY